MKNLKSNKKRKNKIPVSYYPSEYLKKTIAESEREYAEGKTKSYSSVEELIKALNSN